MPIGISVALLISGWERPFVAVFGKDSIEVEGPQGSIPYASLRDVRAAGIPHDPSSYRKPRVPIHVEHLGGMLQIPPRLNAPSHEVYRFLAGQVPPNGDRAVNPALAEYLERQEGAFSGPEHIWTYRAISRSSRWGRFRKFRAFCGGLVLGGVAWMVAGFSGFVDTGWGGGWHLLFTALVGLCFFLVTLADSTGPGQFIKNWKHDMIWSLAPRGWRWSRATSRGKSAGRNCWMSDSGRKPVRSD